MLTLTGSNSASALASTPARYIIGDERDRWATSAGTEGDPWALAEARQATFYNAKAVEVSTPTIKGNSNIETSFYQGTQERWCHRCPECGEYSEIVFDNIHFDPEVKRIRGKKSWSLKSGVSCPFELGSTTTTWARVQAYGERTGLPNILHVMESERPDQYRGVSYLAQVIEPLLQLRRYTESELTAAVVESFFTAFIKTEAGAGDNPFNEVGSSLPEVSRDPNEYEMGPGQINIMEPGEDVTFADPKRPASGFNTFLRAICEQVGAALEIPADLLLKSFNSSYSASRAALMEAWKAFRMRRKWFVDDFCTPVYEIWLSEAVARGRISAPGFFADPAIRAAYLGAEWIGPSQGQLDPTKEITAEILAIGEGITTREQATIRLNGGQWDANVDQLTRENEKLRAAQGQVDQSTAASGTISAALREAIVAEAIKSIKEGDKHENA